MKIVLPNVTLFVLHGGPELALTKLALRDTLARIEPATTLIFTDQPEAWTDTVDPAAIHLIPTCATAADAMLLHWYSIPCYIETPFMLHIEWDGWVIDELAWTDGFLAFDYIGAPWPWYDDGHNVGNGLGIRSTRLMRFLIDHADEFPFDPCVPEDHLICRDYRERLESYGFKFAPESLARRFSLEHHPAADGPFRGDGPFMFHGAFNFKTVLTPEAFAQRVALATDYARGHPSWPLIEAAA